MSFISTTLDYKAVIKKNGILLPVVNVATRQGDLLFDEIKPYGRVNDILHPFWRAKVVGEGRYLIVTQVASPSIVLHKIDPLTGEVIWRTDLNSYGSMIRDYMAVGNILRVALVQKSSYNVVSLDLETGQIAGILNIPSVDSTYKDSFTPEGYWLCMKSGALQAYSDKFLWSINTSINISNPLFYQGIIAFPLGTTFMEYSESDVRVIGTFEKRDSGRCEFDSVGNFYVLKTSASTSTPATIYKYDPTTATLLWSKSRTRQTNAQADILYIRDDVPYFAAHENLSSSNHNLLMRLDPTDGRTLWTKYYTTQYKSGLNTAWYNFGTVFVHRHQTSYRGVSPENGDILWETDLSAQAGLMFANKERDFAYALTTVGNYFRLGKLSLETGEYTVINHQIQLSKFTNYTYRSSFYIPDQELLVMMTPSLNAAGMYVIDLSTGAVIWENPELGDINTKLKLFP